MIPEDVGADGDHSVLRLIVIFGGKGEIDVVVENIPLNVCKHPIGSSLRYASHD